jgi:cytochrome b6-f complex iron-sulfur subunit
MGVPMKPKKIKPVPLKIENAPLEGAVSRRSFFNFIWGVLGLAVLGELVWIAVSFLRPSRQRTDAAKAGSVVEAGSVESFAADSVTAFQRGQFYLVRLNSGGFLALSCKCTHLGCTVPWVEKERKFLCPCHASAFDITGNVISPPAPRPLDLFPVSIENNVVKVDTSKRIKRSGFEAGQVTYAPKG